MYYKTLATLFMLGALVPGPARSELKPATVNTAIIACTSLSDEVRFIYLMRENDKAAATKFIYTYIGNGCNWLNTGTQVFEEHFDSNNAVKYTCVRPRGEINCLWLPAIMLSGGVSSR